MNKCHFVGKLTDDPVLYPRGQTTLARFTLAVEEYRKDKAGKNSAEKKELEDAIEKNRKRDKIEEDIERLSNDSVVSKLRNRWGRKDLL